jgi:siroheme synthase-like protein
MGTHPVFLCLANRRCVVLGGDEQAAAKALACRRGGATVTVVARALVPALEEEIAGGRMTHLAREYRAGDLAGAFVCYASLRDGEEVARVRAEARREGVLLNVMDTPDACDFFAGAVVERGALMIAIGTGGKSPALAARLRERIAADVGAEFGMVVEILGEVRRRLAGRADRNAVLRTLAGSELAALLRAGDLVAVDRLLTRTAGTDCSLARLGIVPDAVE